MNPKQKTPNRVKFLLVSSVVTTVLWVGFDLYRVLTSKPNPVVPPEISAPIDPTLDVDLLKSLPNRIYLVEETNPQP